MNIDRIDITEKNNLIVILPKQNKLIIEERTKDISDEKIEDLIRIIRTWNKEYFNSKLMDGEKFEITIYSDGKEDTIRGIIGLPNNYEEFSKYIRSLYDIR